MTQNNNIQTQPLNNPVEPTSATIQNDNPSSMDEQHNLMRNIPINNIPPTIVDSNYIETKGPELNNKIETVEPKIETKLTENQNRTINETEVPTVEKIIDFPTPSIQQVELNEEIIIPTVEERKIYKEQLDDLLSLAIEKNSSDLHISVDYPPMLRIDGSLVNVGTQSLSKKQTNIMLTTILPKRLLKDLEDDLDVDLSYEHKSGNRFRVNIFNNKGTLAGAFRLIPSNIKSISDLNLPQICYDLIKVPQGLILFTGPTGSGKSTSIAAMIQEINLNYNKHIITIEDPIEYIFPKAKAMVNQRELGVDATDWPRALRELLRQDPNVVLVGEMRDFETISATITVAETGHLVFATLHTNSASQTIDRIIDVFPEGQQNQVRSQLANVIVAVIAQRLIPINKGGRKAIFEVMVATPGIKNAIREGKTYKIDNMIQTNAELGMITLEKSLLQTIRNGEITIEQAVNFTSKPDELISLLNGANTK
jgi:twitching motility protein PilT